MQPSPETLAFVEAHAGEDVRQLALAAGGRKTPAGVDLPFALDQIAGRQAARRKLPSWAAAPGILYPPHLAMEQCSSERTAAAKLAFLRSLFPTSNDSSGMFAGTLVDLTGGFGVDFSTLARGFRHAVYVERQEQLCELVRHNVHALGLDDGRIVTMVNGDGTGYLTAELTAADPVDVIYVDPARRDGHGGRTYAIADCTPDVLALAPALVSRGRIVMIKLSPMLDVDKTVADFEAAGAHVAAVLLIASDGDCKELTVVLQGSSGHDSSVPAGSPAGPATDPARLVCIDDDSTVEFAMGERHGTAVDGAGAVAIADGAACQPHAAAGQGGIAAVPLTEATHLFEPNPAVMKAGCWRAVEERFGVAQVGPNSHLFTADHDVPDFPGRRFEIVREGSFNKKEIRRVLDGVTKANVAVRNFPMPVAALRKKLKLKDGGADYLFATTAATVDASGRPGKPEHVLLLCRKAQ
ncbi:class I SAM-dependent methyltransferase [Bifidobacterium choloepi]|uniref:SAM-dependent methyltransferase n=1 Tax=Bifidobacterium choloepi TaxID=2614131 RepID=A0A6I5N9X6_9BIFI|nr:class I SAM-dependent methyltransferase [Bifidobacterium choloepi]NEG70591.1 SAM-dependent methyltransferase [Bifidobacterium choloepi]